MRYSVFSRQASVLCGRNFEEFDQSGKHPLDLNNVFLKPSLNRDSQCSQVSREAQKIFHFTPETHRHMQEPLEVDPASDDYGRSKC